MTSTGHFVSRRQLLAGSGALFAWACVPRVARAAGRDPRLLVIILRGAIDGLDAVAPIGDPAWHSLRGEAALRLDGPAPGLPLDSMFALNPAMPELHGIYRAHEAIIVHACATPYRERSHFDGQNILESGYTRPGVTESGWLNRALGSIEPEGGAQKRSAVGIGPVAPLIVRGPAPVLAWAPSGRRRDTDDTLMRVLDLYRHSDPELSGALEAQVDLAAIVSAGGVEASDAKAGTSRPVDAAGRVRSLFVRTAAAAARILANPDGPRIGALDLNGWDTHADQGAHKGRLAVLLSGLDAALAAIKKESGPVWREMVVAVISEFGRTARLNGTRGTDHGTATIALLAGGALKGGRVIADWPGLRHADLHETRDLKPTTDLRAVLKGVLKEHLHVGDNTLGATVFPDSGTVRPLSGLMT
jgi:uncharacterized protein (DUF1501 family)